MNHHVSPNNAIILNIYRNKCSCCRALDIGIGNVSIVLDRHKPNWSNWDVCVCHQLTNIFTCGLDAQIWKKNINAEFHTRGSLKRIYLRPWTTCYLKMHFLESDFLSPTQDGRTYSIRTPVTFKFRFPNIFHQTTHWMNRCTWLKMRKWRLHI